MLGAAGGHLTGTPRHPRIFSKGYKGVSNMQCPACKAETVIVEHEGIELDYCLTCKGVWFDAGELELLLESCGMTDCRPFLEDMLNRRADRVDEEPRKCPRCRKKMRKVLIDAAGSVPVDVCRHGHGIWFDHKEVEALAAALAAQAGGDGQAAEKVLDYLGEVFKY